MKEFKFYWLGYEIIYECEFNRRQESIYTIQSTILKNSLKELKELIPDWIKIKSVEEDLVNGKNFITR